MVEENFGKREMWKRNSILMRWICEQCPATCSGALFTNAIKMYFAYEMHNPM
jgi:hypothetical protein